MKSDINKRIIRFNMTPVMFKVLRHHHCIVYNIPLGASVSFPY